MQTGADVLMITLVGILLVVGGVALALYSRKGNN